MDPPGEPGGRSARRPSRRAAWPGPPRRTGAVSRSGVGRGHHRRPDDDAVDPGSGALLGVPVGEAASPGDDHRAAGVVEHRHRDRAEQHRGERAAAARADHEHAGLLRGVAEHPAHRARPRPAGRPATEGCLRASAAAPGRSAAPPRRARGRSGRRRSGWRTAARGPRLQHVQRGQGRPRPLGVLEGEAQRGPARPRRRRRPRPPAWPRGWTARARPRRCTGACMATCWLTDLPARPRPGRGRGCRARSPRWAPRRRSAPGAGPASTSSRLSAAAARRRPRVRVRGQLGEPVALPLLVELGDLAQPHVAGGHHDPQRGPVARRSRRPRPGHAWRPASRRSRR